MAETLLQKAQRLGIKPSGESLLQKAQRLGIKPTGVNAQGKFALTETREDTVNKITQYQAQAEKSKKEADKLSSPLGIAKSFIKNIGSTIASSEVGLANTISGIANTKNLKSYNQNITDLTDINLKTLKQIEDYEKVGKDATQLKKQYNNTKSLIDENVNKIKEIQGGVSKTTGQVIGEIGGTALDVLTAGTYGTATKGLKTGFLGASNTGAVKSIATAVSPELGQIATQKAGGLLTRQGLGNIAKGAGIGYGYDVSTKLQEGKTGMEAFTPGVGTLIGGGLPAISETAKTFTKMGDPQTLINKRVIALDKIDNTNSSVRKVVSKSKEKGVDVKNILAQTDLLQGAVDNTGTLRTQNAIQEVNDLIRPQEKVISEALKVEGNKMSLKEIENQMIKSLNESNITGSAKTSAINGIKKEIAGLRLDADKNGDILISKIHDAKVNKYANINYLNPESKISDKLIARVEKELVENNTKSVDVKKLNSELSQHFAVLDYLEKLDGKKVEGGKLGKYFAQTVGAIVGSSFGPLGSIIGAEAGGMIRGKQLSSTFGSKLIDQYKKLPIYNYYKQRGLSDDEIVRQINQSSKSLGNLNNNQINTNKNNSAINNNIPKNRSFNKGETPTKLGSLDYLIRKEQASNKSLKVYTAKPSQTMDISKLISHEGAPDLKQVEKYKKDILSGKNIKPLLVIKEGNKFGIEDGKHRYQAMKELGIKEIPIEIVRR